MYFEFYEFMRRRTCPLSPNCECRVHIPCVLYNHVWLTKLPYDIFRDLSIKTSKANTYGFNSIVMLHLNISKNIHDLPFLDVKGNTIHVCVFKKFTYCSCHICIYSSCNTFHFRLHWSNHWIWRETFYERVVTPVYCSRVQQNDNNLLHDCQ